MDGEDKDALGEHMDAVAQDAEDLDRISQLDSPGISFNNEDRDPILHSRLP